MGESERQVDAVTGADGPSERLDADEVGRFAFRVWSYKQGEMVSLLIHLGDRLGLYRALDGVGRSALRSWLNGLDCSRAGCASGSGATRRPTCSRPMTGSVLS